jgi:hypothetical protein
MLTPDQLVAVTPRQMTRAADPVTSHSAASRVRHGALSTTQYLVLGAIRLAGARGLTDAELAALPIFRHLRESTARKRRCELAAAGYVIHSGVIRDHQTVWVTTSATPEPAPLTPNTPAP